MNKLKEYWGYVAAAVAGLVGLLLYLLSNKKDEVNALQAKVDLASTEKQSDVLDAEINQAKANEDNLAQHNKALDQVAANLDTKRAEIKDEQAKVTDPKAIADYWNHQ